MCVCVREREGEGGRKREIFIYEKVLLLENLTYLKRNNSSSRLQQNKDTTIKHERQLDYIMYKDGD